MNSNNFFQSTPKKDENQSGWPATNTTNTSLFGSNPVQQTSNSIVPFQGNQPTLGFSQNTPSIFGSNPNTQPQLNLFGSSSGFGTNTQNTAPNTSFNNNFTPFGSANTQNTSSSPFGTNITQNSSTSPFGMNNTTSTNSNPFGMTSSQSSFSNNTNPFGNNTMQTFGTNTTQQSPFGTSANTSSMFTNPPNTSSSFSTGSSIFGNKPATSSSFSTPAFGSAPTVQSSFGSSQATTPWNAPVSTPAVGWGMMNKGSKIATYSSTRTNEDGGIYGDLVDITAMQAYKNKSIDEIRQEDYEQSLTPPKQQSTGPFISVGQTSTSPFTQNVSTFPTLDKPMTSFGTPSSFASSSPFGENKPIQSLFGSAPSTTSFSTQSNAAPLFGNTLQTTNPFSAGNTTTATSNISTTSPFSSLTNNTSPFSQPAPTSFTTPQNQQSGNTTNLFSTQPAVPQTASQSSLFNNNAQQMVGSGLTSSTPSFMFNTPSSMSAFKPANESSTLTTQFPGQQNVFQAQTINHPRVDLNDPYMLKNVTFEKFEQQKPAVRMPLPTPIFKSRKDTAMVDLKMRAPRSTEKHSIFTIPDIKDIRGTQTIANFVVGFEGKGRIEFLDPITVSSFDELERKIQFRGNTVEVADPIGTGLNRRARVYVENLFVRNEEEKHDSFAAKAAKEKFVYDLKKLEHRQFIDYNTETGVYVYEVNHF